VDTHNLSKPIFSLQNVGIYYTQRSGIRRRKFWALEDVSFELFHGETLGILGKNGAGKSTLIKLLAGIIAPDRGYIYRQGMRISRLALNLGLQGNLSGRQNAILSGILLGMTRREIKSELDNIIEFSQLGDFFDQPVKAYSSGMQARLGFSVALHSNPDVLLIDEILGVGDADFRAKSTEALRSLIKSDKTVVFVSHNIPMIRQLCDRVVWLENRKSKLVGPTDDVLPVYEQAQTKPQ